MAAVRRFTLALEDFNTHFIRLPTSRPLSFSALSVLHTLSRRGPLRLSDLLRSEQLKQPALTSLVGNLVEAGLVIRRPHPSDGRAALLSLTAEGEDVVRQRHLERARRLASALTGRAGSDRELLVLAQLLRDVTAALAAGDEPTAPAGALSDGAQP